MTNGPEAGLSGDAGAFADGEPPETGGDGAARGLDGGAQDGSDGSPPQPSDAAPPRPLPTLVSVSEICKLINGQGDSDPTLNEAQTRANLLGTDLGIPIDAAGTLYFFFG